MMTSRPLRLFFKIASLFLMAGVLLGEGLVYAANPVEKLFGYPEPESNEKPMYGFSSYEEFIQSRTVRQEVSDKELLRKIAQGPGGEAEGFRHLISRGWQYLSRDDGKTSMKRFNQAMLLRPHDFNVYWGFAANMGSQEKFEESLVLFEKARAFYRPEQLLNDWDYVTFLRDFARSHLLKIDAMQEGPEKQATAERLVALVDEGLSQPLAQKNPDMVGDMNLMAAVGLYEQGKYEESWKKVHAAKDLFPRLFEDAEVQDFVKALSKKMPEGQE